MSFGSYLRPTYSDIARRLGVDEETVRIRVRQARQAGTILGWQLAINPRLLGSEATSVLLQVRNPSLKGSLISQIKLIDGVVLIMDFYDRPLRVVFYHESDRDRERRIELMKSICGDDNPTSWQIGFAPLDVKLKRTDWHIMKELHRDLLQSNSEIAEALRVSARTVKRRISFMTEARVIYSFAIGDVKRQSGMSFFFLLDCPDEKKKSGLDEKIISKLENAVFVDTRNKRYSVYVAIFHNTGEAEEAYGFIKHLEGAERTRMYVMREIISVHDWFDKEIEKHVDERGRGVGLPIGKLGS